DHDQQHRDERDHSAGLSDLLARHLAQRFAIAPHRREQNHEVLDSAPEYAADNDPQRAWQITELRRDHWAHQRSGTGDGGEMVTEQDPFVRRNEIVSVIETLGRGRALVVERHHPRGNEFPIEPEPDEVRANRREHEPHAVYRFPALDGDRAQADGGHAGDRSPRDSRQKSHRNEIVRTGASSATSRPRYGRPSSARRP